VNTIPGVAGGGIRSGSAPILALGICSPSTASINLLTGRSLGSTVSAAVRCNISFDPKATELLRW
jgi:hypothetical protein